MNSSLFRFTQQRHEWPRPLSPCLCHSLLVPVLRQKEIDRVRSDIIRLLEDDKDNEVLMEGVNLAKRGMGISYLLLAPVCCSAFLLLELGLLEFGAVEGKGAGLKGQVLRFRYDLKTASDLTPDEQRFQKMIIK